MTWQYFHAWQSLWWENIVVIKKKEKTFLDWFYQHLTNATSKHAYSFLNNPLLKRCWLPLLVSKTSNYPVTLCLKKWVGAENMHQEVICRTSINKCSAHYLTRWHSSGDAILLMRTSPREVLTEQKLFEIVENPIRASLPWYLRSGSTKLIPIIYFFISSK